MFGWTAASLVPPHQVAAAATAAPVTNNLSGTQTYTPAQVPALDVTQNMNTILQKILGPNYVLGANPSPIAGSAALYSPNYLAQAQAGTLPQPNPVTGFTQFGNSYWKMPPQQPANTMPVSGVQKDFAPAATNYGAPSAWVSNQQNLFNI